MSGQLAPACALLLDAGNTRIKWALVDADAPLGQWLAQGAHPHAEADALPGAIASALAQAGAGVTAVLVANVAGPAVRAQLAAALTQLGIDDRRVDWFASVAQRAGVRNGYRHPGQLGCDRFAAAIGAHALAPQQAIVVANCGTATTIDAVRADGSFLGGMILPGLGLMASSLARNTAQLPQIAAGATLPQGFADNTDDAILTGCLAAQAGAIERAFALHQAVSCIISGGAAPYVAPTLLVPHRHVDNIVMIGLHAALQDS
jgi:type III pantothenate kinase